MLEVESVKVESDITMNDLLVAMQFLKGAESILKGELELADSLNIELDLESPDEEIRVANDLYQRMSCYIDMIREQIVGRVTNEEDN